MRRLKTFDIQFSFFKNSALTRNITKVFGGDVLSRAIGLLTALLVIRGLSVTDYAAYTAFFSIAMFIPGLVGIGVNNALVTFSTEYISRTGKRPLELYLVSFLFQMALYVIFGSLLYILSDEVTSLLFGQKPFDSAFRYGLLAGVGYLISQAGRGVYNAEEKFGIYIKILWFRQLTALGILLVLFFIERLTFLNVVQAIICVEVGVAVIISFRIFRDTDLKAIITKLKEQSDIIKEFISSTKWLIAYFFMLISFQRLGVFMLSHFSTEQELANYGVAFKYYSLFLLALHSINAVLLPKFSKVDMQDFGRQRQFIFKWLKATGWLIIPIVIIDVFGKPFFILVNGVQYEHSFSIFIVFSFGIWLSLMLSPLVNVIKARKKFTFLFFLGLSAFIINFIGNYLLIPAWGGLAAAAVSIASHGLINGAAFIKLVFSKE